MKNYMFMRPVLRYIGEGTLFASVFASFLRVAAILQVIGALVAWIGLWKLVFDLEGTALLGGILFQAFFVIGVYMITHVMWIRADDMDSLGKSDFTVIPIVSILLKMIGEIYASVFVAAGVALGALTLFAGYGEATREIFQSGLPGLGLTGIAAESFAATGSFVVALLTVFSGAFIAVLWLAVFYLASEAIVVIVDIARNTRVLRELSERRAQPVPIDQGGARPARVAEGITGELSGAVPES